MTEKKLDFVVSDRRRFGSEGEPRAGAPVEQEEKPPVPEPSSEAVQPPTAAPQQAGETTQPAAGDQMPEAPSVEEQLAQHQEYRASGQKLDEIFHTRLGAQGGYPEMTFEKVIESLYMSALIQMGALRSEGEEPRVDIIGARQTIDSLTIIHDKTKGNLTDRERTMLQNVLFELRMAWIELTNAIAKQAAEQPGKPTQEKK
jgi:hypothetical protein